MSKSKNANIWFEKCLIESKAFVALKTATAHKALALFFTKRQVTKRKGSRNQWDITNNGEITFTYREAKRKLSIKSDKTFRRAIDELRDKGFIDIAASGYGLYKSSNLYSISERWKLYGTPEYKQPKPRPQKAFKQGFKRGNQYGKNCKKKKTTVEGDRSSTVAG